MQGMLVVGVVGGVRMEPSGESGARMSGSQDGGVVFAMKRAGACRPSGKGRWCTR